MHTKEQLTTVCTMPCASSQQHTLPKRDNMHSISEVLIPNNDQHQLKKTATTNNRINSKIKQQHTTYVDWCYCLREVLFQKMFVVVYKFALHGQQFSCQTGKGNSQKHLQFWQGCCEEDALRQLCLLPINWIWIELNWVYWQQKVCWIIIYICID